MNTPSSELQSKITGKFLIFNLDNESYAIDAMHVLEILRNGQITRVPKTAPHIKGVMNLRGKIVPILDLRARFGIEQQQEGDDNCIVVVHIKSHEGHVIQTGLIVDAVESVQDMDTMVIEETPSSCGLIDAIFISFIAHEGEKVIRILDITPLIQENIV